VVTQGLLWAMMAAAAVSAHAITPNYRYGYWIPYVDAAHSGRTETYSNLSLYAFSDTTHVLAGDQEMVIPPWGGLFVAPPILREGLHIRSDRPLSGLYDFMIGDAERYEDGWLSYALTEDRRLGTEYWIPTRSTEVSVMATENFTEVTVADTTYTLHRGESRRLIGIEPGTRIAASHPVAVAAAHYEDDHYSATWAYQVPPTERIGQVYCLPRRHPYAYRDSTEASRVCLLALTDGTAIRVNSTVVNLNRGEQVEVPLPGEATLVGNHPFYAIGLMDVAGRDPRTGTRRSYVYALAPLPPEAGLGVAVVAPARTSPGHGAPSTEVAITSLEDRNVIRLVSAGRADFELSLNRGETRYFHEDEISGWTTSTLRIESLRPMQVVQSVRGWWYGISEFATGEVVTGIPLSEVNDESEIGRASCRERVYVQV
jgi:hypothetical protein